MANRSYSTVGYGFHVLCKNMSAEQIAHWRQLEEAVSRSHYKTDTTDLEIYQHITVHESGDGIDDPNENGFALFARRSSQTAQSGESLPVFSSIDPTWNSLLDTAIRECNVQVFEEPKVWLTTYYG